MKAWSDQLGRYVTEAGSMDVSLKYSESLGCGYLKMVVYDGQGSALQTQVAAQCNLTMVSYSDG
jgi:hypothetical protein